MNRRTFLQSLAAAIGLGPKLAKAVPTKAIKQMPLTKSQVAMEIEAQHKLIMKSFERRMLADQEWLSSHES